MARSRGRLAYIFVILVALQPAAIRAQLLPLASLALPAGIDALSVGDVNGDSRDDVVARNSVSVGEVREHPTTTIYVFLGNADGSFSAAPAQPTLNIETFQHGVADMNADGRADLILLSAFLDVYLGRADGTFDFAASWFHVLTPQTSFALATGDLDADGTADLVWPSAPNVLSVRLSSLGTVTQLATSLSHITALVCGKLRGPGVNDAGVIDIVSVNGNFHEWLLNDGSGQVSPARGRSTAAPMHLAMANRSLAT